MYIPSLGLTCVCTINKNQKKRKKKTRIRKKKKKKQEEERKKDKLGFFAQLKCLCKWRTKEFQGHEAFSVETSPPCFPVVCVFLFVCLFLYVFLEFCLFVMFVFLLLFCMCFLVSLLFVCVFVVFWLLLFVFVLFLFVSFWGFFFRGGWVGGRLFCSLVFFPPSMFLFAIVKCFVGWRKTKRYSIKTLSSLGKFYALCLHEGTLHPCPSDGAEMKTITVIEKSVCEGRCLPCEYSQVIGRDERVLVEFT